MARTFAAKKRLYWNRWRAKKVSHVLNRHSLRLSVCMASRQRLTTRKHLRLCRLLSAMVAKPLPIKALKARAVRNYFLFRDTLNAQVIMKLRWVRHFRNCWQWLAVCAVARN